MDKIKEMEAYAKANGVPIMETEGIAFLCEFIKEHKFKRILEIGSAIGYSAIRMALLDDEITITTIERDDDRYALAVKNIAETDLSNRITIIHGDALETIVDGEYDMIFIDAAKAQYIRFFERYEAQLRVGGFMVSDNLKFHGLVEHPEEIQSRQLRQLVKKIQKFNEYLTTRTDFETVFIDLGDGVATSQKICREK